MRSTARAKGIRSTPLIDGGRVFVGAYNGNLYCLDQSSGNLVWSVKACDWIGSSPVALPGGLVAVGLEFARPGKAGAIAAFDRADGRLAWMNPLRNLQHGSGAYATESGALIFGTSDDCVVSLRPQDGALIWRYVTGSPVKQKPALHPRRGMVAVAGQNGCVHVLSQQTGQPMAVLDLGAPCRGSPLITDTRIFCGSTSGNLLVADLDTLGITARLRLEAPIVATPVEIGGHVAVAATDGSIHLLHQASLAFAGRFTVPGAVTTPVAVGDGGVFLLVGTDAGELFCFRKGVERATKEPWAAAEVTTV